MFGEKNYTDRGRREGGKEGGREREGERGREEREIKRGERVMKLPIGRYYPRDISCYKLWEGDPPIPQRDAATETDWSGKGKAVHRLKTLVHAHGGEQKYQERWRMRGERGRKRRGESLGEREGRAGGGGGEVMPL